MYEITVYARMFAGHFHKMDSGRGTLGQCFRTAKRYPDSHYRVVVRRVDVTDSEIVRCVDMWCRWPQWSH